MIPTAVRWAFVGGLVGRAVPPITPSKTADAAIFAGVFATKTGQRMMWWMGVRTVGAAGTVVGAAFGSTVVGVALGAGAGVVIGAATGTAISSAIWGEKGKQTAIDFYTGVNTSWYDYIPQYSAYRIVRHKIKDAIE
jgi:hypothetical protein